MTAPKYRDGLEKRAYHPHRYYTVGHIPGAVQVQRFKDLGDNTGRSIMLFPGKDTFQSTLRRFLRACTATTWRPASGLRAWTPSTCRRATRAR